jgi:hypothetical protein
LASASLLVSIRHRIVGFGIADKNVTIAGVALINLVTMTAMLALGAA